ncbi:hypothetical protein C8R47DRAFT_1162404 [Mycena vitilis]|nr:hypothetical protein C8R47DRAFT_1162404 [Mycena vitilis]
MDVNFLASPYSPEFSPLASTPEFAFSVQDITESKYWPGRVEPQIYEEPPPSAGWPLPSIAPFDAASWDEMILSALSPLSCNSAYALPSPPSLLSNLPPCPSPSPSASSLDSHSSTSTSSSPVISKRTLASASGKTCSHCAATSTPLWRRDPATHLPLCNACGLYLQQRNKMRPAALIAADAQSDEEPEGGEGDVAAGAPECTHCHTHRTSVWRRSKSGARLCNACGVYARLRGRDRPLSLRKNKIRPRCKHPPK